MSASAAEMAEKHPARSWIRYVLPSQGDMLFIALFIGVIALGPRLMNMDGDLGRHLTIGKYILDEWTIPTKDIFSHTMNGLHLTPHEWLAQVLFAISFQLGGLNGVVLLCALVLAMTFTIVFRQSYSRSKLILVSLVITVLAAAAASVHWLARPHIFTLLLTALWIGELEKWRLGKSWRWWLLPIIMLVWVNTHGAFIVGLLIWLIYLVGSSLSAKFYSNRKDIVEDEDRDAATGKPTKKLVLIGVPILAVTLINPAGWRVWSTTFGFLQNQYLVSHTVEYQAPDFQLTSFWPFLIMICLSILLAAINTRKLSLVGVLLVVAWTGFSLISARNIAIYAVVAAPILAGIAASIVLDKKVFGGILGFDKRIQLVDDRLSGNIWPVIFTVLIGFMLIFGAEKNTGAARNQFSENVFPVKAVNWIEEHPSTEPIFNYFPWGGYLLYRIWPQELVFIDGQTDFYGESLTREYEKVITLADGWQEILLEYQVGRVLMPSDSDLVEGLPQVDGWKVVFLDQTAAVLDYSP
jgi:hypothetical protein